MEEYIEYHKEVLTSEELEKVAGSFIQEEETKAEPAIWILPKFASVSNCTHIKRQNYEIQSWDGMQH